MRGPFDDQEQLFSYLSPEQRVPATHPLRTIRMLVREVLSELDHDFRILYSTTGRPSIPPEQLLSAWRLHVFYGVRSERQLMEQLDDKLLYRWFVGLASDDAVWDATTFTKNRERLQQGDLFNRFMETRLHHQAVTPKTPLVGRPQWKIYQPPSLKKNEQAWREHVHRSTRAGKATLAAPFG
jgi:transposase